MRYHILGVRFQIDTDVLLVEHFLSGIYENFLKESGNDAQILYKINSDGSSSVQECVYTISKNGRNLGNYTDISEVLLYLEQSIMDDIVLHISHLFLIHAAALVNNDEAIILAGPSHSGKSTLAMALVRRGFGYLSDEIAPIEPESYRVFPFPRGIKLRKQVLQLFSLDDSVAEANQYIFNLSDSQRARAGSSFDIKCILFPAYIRGVKPELKQISTAIALGMLAKCSLNFHNFQEDPIVFLSELVNDRNCYKFITNDINDSCRIIEEMF